MSIFLLRPSEAKHVFSSSLLASKTKYFISNTQDDLCLTHLLSCQSIYNASDSVARALNAIHRLQHILEVVCDMHACMTPAHPLEHAPGQLKVALGVFCMGLQHR